MFSARRPCGGIVICNANDATNLKIDLFYNPHKRQIRIAEMRGTELLDRLQRLARKRGVDFSYNPERGKGSHGGIRFGNRTSVMSNPRRELKKGIIEHLSGPWNQGTGPLR